MIGAQPAARDASPGWGPGALVETRAAPACVREPELQDDMHSGLFESHGDTPLEKFPGCLCWRVLGAGSIITG